MRNFYAEQAARDHSDRAEKLLVDYMNSGDAVQLKESLDDCQRHAENCGLAFDARASVPGHQSMSRSRQAWDNEYAARLHWDAAYW